MYPGTLLLLKQIYPQKSFTNYTNLFFSSSLKGRKFCEIVGCAMNFPKCGRFLRLLNSDGPASGRGKEYVMHCFHLPNRKYTDYLLKSKNLPGGLQFRRG